MASKPRVVFLYPQLETVDCFKLKCLQKIFAEIPVSKSCCLNLAPLIVATPLLKAVMVQPENQPDFGQWNASYSFDRHCKKDLVPVD